MSQNDGNCDVLMCTSSHPLAHVSPITMYVQKQGALTPGPWPGTGLRPIRNWAAQVAGKCICAALFARAVVTHHQLHVCMCARHLGKWSCVHKCVCLLLTQNHFLFPHCRSAKPERLRTSVQKDRCLCHSNVMLLSSSDGWM